MRERKYLSVPFPEATVVGRSRSSYIEFEMRDNKLNIHEIVLLDEINVFINYLF